MRRSSTIRDRHRRTIAAQGKPCWICGKPIDYALKWPDPKCFVVDHVVPIDKGGPDVLENCRPAHHRCNRIKSDKPHADAILKRSATIK